MPDNKSLVVAMNEEMNVQLADPKVCVALLATTFKGLQEKQMKQAILEGMIRGLTFKNFLEKDVYAIPFKDGYSLITSIDFGRKKGMRSGIVGKKAPEFEMGENKKIISCTVTVQRKIEGYVGDFTATVYFDEYYKVGKNGYPSLWDSKPRTMIAKVAEMHALRMACPEELSQSYIEEELESENFDSFGKRLSKVDKDKESIKMGKFLKEDVKENKEEQVEESSSSEGDEAQGD